MTKVREKRVAGSASAVALPADGKSAILLMKIGANPARDGRIVYRVDDQAHAEAVVAASRKYFGATEMMVDYDHQSVFGAKDGVGGRAEAAGWIDPATLRADNDGVWGDAVWTQAASQALADRRYRYISPYFGHDAGGRVTRIFNAALTNRPELELQAVASADDFDGDETDMDKIANALGLPTGATIDQIMQALAQVTTATASARAERTAVCVALGLAADATTAEIATAASAKAPDPAAFVPRAEFDSLRSEIQAFRDTRVTASVDAAISSGKIAPASRTWAMGYAAKDPDGFAAFVGTAPAIVAPGAEERHKAALASDTLTDEERAVCSMMGIKEADFIAARKEELSR